MYLSHLVLKVKNFFTSEYVQLEQHILCLNRQTLNFLSIIIIELFFCTAVKNIKNVKN